MLSKQNGELWMARAAAVVALWGTGGCSDDEDAVLCCGDSDRGGDVCTVSPGSRLAYCADPRCWRPSADRAMGRQGDELAGHCVAPEPTVDAGIGAGGAP